MRIKWLEGIQIKMGMCNADYVLLILKVSLFFIMIWLFFNIYVFFLFNSYEMSNNHNLTKQCSALLIFLKVERMVMNFRRLNFLLVSMRRDQYKWLYKRLFYVDIFSIKICPWMTLILLLHFLFKYHFLSPFP